MRRVAAVLFLLAMASGCVSAPSPIEVTHVTRAPRDRDAEVAAFWAARARARPSVVHEFYKPDPRLAYREKWRAVVEDQAWRDAAWGRKDKRLTIR